MSLKQRLKRDGVLQQVKDPTLNSMHPLPAEVVLPIKFGYASSKDRVNQALKEELIICDFLERGSWDQLHNRNKKLVEKQRQALRAAVQSESTKTP